MLGLGSGVEVGGGERWGWLTVGVMFEVGDSGVS